MKIGDREISPLSYQERVESTMDLVMRTSVNPEASWLQVRREMAEEEARSEILDEIHLMLRTVLESR